jgi:SNF2 family DNA or RNA helicase
MLLTLDPHQVATVDFALRNPYSIFALDMGLGKTIVALELWSRLKGHCLVICPSYLVLNWQSEIRKCLGEEPVVTVIRKGKEIYEIFDSDIVIVSYDLAQKSEQLFEWADMVILDEGQELKSMKAKRTNYIHKVVYENSIKRLHILTGTPIKNRVEEYYSLLALMNYDPRIERSEFLERFPDSVTFADYFSYREEFTMEINNRWVTIVRWKDVRNEDELKSYLKGKYIRFSSDKILKIPAPRMKDILISETPDKGLLAEFNKHYEDEENKSVGPSKKAEAALKKVPFTTRYVQTLLEEIECVPVYTDHVESAKALAAAFDVPPITGEMNPAMRMKLGQRFQRGELKVLVATVKSFSTGVNLTRANNLVFNDYPWVPGDIKQTIYRIQRRDQTRPCLIHRILGSPQDKYILDTLESKTATIDKVV